MDYADLRTELETRLAAMQQRLANLKREASRTHSGDSAEQAQERENDEVIDAIGNETRATIKDIQAALARIDDDSYGICEECGEEIGRSRLQAIPEATRCVQCAD